MAKGKWQYCMAGKLTIAHVSHAVWYIYLWTEWPSVHCCRIMHASPFLWYAIGIVYITVDLLNILWRNF